MLQGSSPRGSSPRGRSPRRSMSPSRERQIQQDYWKEHTSALDGATVNAMMLDSQVLAMLGSVAGKRVVELGAGIGRFSGALAATAKSVLAVDFMENLIAENRKSHGHRGNIEFEVADATEMDLPEGSCDVVFSNWLLMYLDDQEVEQLASDALAWVTEGGTVFFRESCFRQSGDKPRKNNPTHYRNPRDYFAIFDKVENMEEDGRFSHFELVSCKCVDTYVRVKHNQNQICWKWRKVVTERACIDYMRNFLDTQQYSTRGILRYERIFGEGFVSTGGIETTSEFLALLKLKPNEKVLDVGCGIGGGDFLMAENYSVFVHGIDLSVNMVLLALERASNAKRTKVSFEIADIMTCDIRPNLYDVIYSRDTILHIEDKAALFRSFPQRGNILTLREYHTRGIRNLLSSEEARESLCDLKGGLKRKQQEVGSNWFYEMLRPGGRLLISDYCRAEGEPSTGFAAYIQQRGYHLHSVQRYGELIESAGFSSVMAEDRTWQMEASLRRELETAAKERDHFVKEFSQQDYDYIVNGWQDKLNRLDEQKWGLFRAVKQPVEE